MTTEIKQKKWEGEIPVHYLYTYGLAGEHFFRTIKEKGAFVATCCEKCDVTYVPPRIYCERCFAELKDYKQVDTKGTVETFTVCHESADGTKLAKPEIIASVRLNGTNGGLVDKLSGVAEDKVKIGMKVEAVFADAPKRTGAITDILHFKAY